MNYQEEKIKFEQHMKENHDARILEIFHASHLLSQHVLFDCFGFPITADLRCALCLHPLNLQIGHQCRKITTKAFVADPENGLVPLISVEHLVTEFIHNLPGGIK